METYRLYEIPELWEEFRGEDHHFILTGISSTAQCRMRFPGDNRVGEMAL
jgi:hypothetical protein